MKILQRTVDILTKPTQYFRNINKEKELKDAFVYYFIYSLVFGTITTLISVFILNSSISFLYSLIGMQNLVDIISKTPQPGIAFVMLFFIISYPFRLGFSFLWAAILYVWILLFEGQADYKKTYQLYAYTKTPIFIFGWIPVLGFLAGIYRLILLIYGTAEVHKIRFRTAVLMYVIPYVIFMLLSIGLMVFAFLVLSRLGIDNALYSGGYLPK